MSSPEYPSNEEIIAKMAAFNEAQQRYTNASNSEEQKQAYAEFDGHLQWLISHRVEFWWDVDQRIMQLGRPFSRE